MPFRRGGGRRGQSHSLHVWQLEGEIPLYSAPSPLNILGYTAESNRGNRGVVFFF